MAPDKPPAKPSLLAEIGLAGATGFAKDGYFYGALLAAPLLLMLLELVLPAWRTGITVNATVLLSMVLLHPLLEELLFRGVIQGVIQKAIQGADRRAIEGANPGAVPHAPSPSMHGATRKADQGRLQETHPGAHEGLKPGSHWTTIRRLWWDWCVPVISKANLLTTVLFSLLHLFQHSALWAAAVIVPSLVFGYFRDRHGHAYSALILHAAYNACYLALGTSLNMVAPL